MEDQPRPLGGRLDISLLDVEEAPPAGYPATIRASLRPVGLTERYADADRYAYASV